MDSSPSKASHWHVHITAWQAQRPEPSCAYCARHGLKPATFAYWRGKQRKATQPLTLIPLNLGTGTGPILTSPGGWRLELPGSLPAHWLAELLGRLP